jgi:recombination protein RecA
MTSKSLDEIIAAAYTEEGLTEQDILGDAGAVSSGNLALDHILGVGGFPRGRTVELSGLSQAGKTTVGCQVAAEAQRNGETVVYVDFEQALDEPYLNALGVRTRDPADPTRFHPLFRPYPAASLEQGMEVAAAAVRSGEVGVIVFDSVAAMTPRKSVEEYSDSRMQAAERARLLGYALSSLNPNLARTGTTAIFINHIRDVIETGPTRPGMPKRTTTIGGSALKFYASVRAEFTVVKTFKHERFDVLTGEKIDEPHAVLVKVKVTKNKLAPPFQSAELYLELGKGFSNPYSAMSVLVGNKVVRKAGAYYYFPDSIYHPQMKSGDKGPSMQGIQSVLDLAEMDAAWGVSLADAARSVLADHRKQAPQVVPEPIELDRGEPDPRPEPAAEALSLEESSTDPPAPVFAATRASEGSGVRFGGPPPRTVGRS